MKRFVQKAYMACVIVLAVLFLYMLVNFDVDIEREQHKEGYEYLTAYDVSTVADENAPVGIRQEYSFRIDGITSSYRDIVFYSIHQNVEVYIGEECVYAMKPAATNTFGKTPGCIWNHVILDEEDNGATIKIVCFPVYKSSVDIVPEVFLGTRYSVYADIVKSSAPSVLLGILAVLIGALFIVLILYNYKNTEVDKGILMLGVFAMQVGIWKLADTSFLNLLTTNYPAVDYLPFVALLLVCIPFIMYIKELHNNKEEWIWYIPCVCSLLNIVCTVVLQVTGIADMRQMLIYSHLVIAVAIVTTVGMVAREVVVLGWNAKLKRNVYCLMVCFLGTGIDLGLYYVSHGQKMTVIGMLSFLSYIVVLGAYSVKEAKELMNKGMQAKRYVQMAYHDQLTGLYNRTAYAEHTEQKDFRPEQYIVVMFDLNDLKLYNDRRGHHEGDRYIVECAKLIQTVFGDGGNCYRMGGDEFCVLLKNSSFKDCGRRVKRLKTMIQQYNAEHAELQMDIACGYEAHDAGLDYDIGDTLRRADRKMYHEKFFMKQEKVDGAMH